MSDIFISYARTDQAKAQVLAEALEQKGWSVWWDPKILPGRTFHKVIEEALEAAKCVIVLWSKESIASDWVITEAAEGKRRGILVPALIDQVEPPLEFKQIEAANLVDWQLENPEFDLLFAAVTAVVGSPKLPKSPNLPKPTPRKGTISQSKIGENRNPKWWIVSIAAPIIAGLTIWMVQKSVDPETGELQISCDIDSAQVYLNEQPSGLTINNETLKVSSLTPGNYFLSIKKDGFASYDTQNVKIAAGEITFLKAKLIVKDMPKEIPKPGNNKPQTEATLHPLTITVQSQFKNAKIFIDGEWKANAPSTVSLSQGQHLLRIEKNDYFYEEMIDVSRQSLVNILDSEFQKVQAANK